MIVYRNCNLGNPFVWDAAGQPEGRWNKPGDDPVQYFADTPHGAWAEFIRHEGLRTEDDLEDVQRSLWAVEIGDPPTERPLLDEDVARGNDTYLDCQAEADRLRKAGAHGLIVRSAALLDGGATGQRVDGIRLYPAETQDGNTIVLFGPQPDAVGWKIVNGRPPAFLLDVVRHMEL